MFSPREDTERKHRFAEVPRLGSLARDDRGREAQEDLWHSTAARDARAALICPSRVMLEAIAWRAPDTFSRQREKGHPENAKSRRSIDAPPALSIVANDSAI
jgi:hypothetical protein